MKISRDWLQTYFEKELPDAMALSDTLTFHAFEIESVENDILDVKVTPNRGHDCLSHRGIAKELSAILKLPMRNDPLREQISLEPRADRVAVVIKEPNLCSRYIAAHIRGIEVGPTKNEKIVRFLESIGQRAINNIVDATNYVMFNLGQPLHAFDALDLAQGGDNKKIVVRRAFQDEPITSLDNKQYLLSTDNLVIADGVTGAAVGIAGVKGGISAGVKKSTHDIILESANFDGVSVRRTSQSLKLRTDASERFQQVLSPELAAYGIRAAADLIIELAGGELVGFADEYPSPTSSSEILVSVSEVNDILGLGLAESDMADVLARLDLPFKVAQGTFTIHVPFERLDLSIPEDIAEEIGRIIGYDKIPSAELSAFPDKPPVNRNFFWSERIREDLMSDGYSEVYTSVFRESGEREVLNKVGGERPYLRANLTDGLSEALERNVRNKELLGIPEVRLFEIGSVWRKGKEELCIGVASEKGGVSEKLLSDMAENIPEGISYEALPLSSAGRYSSFSRYPYIVRDIALWVPGEQEPKEVEDMIRGAAGELLQRIDLFDRFEKNGKVSLAFRLVFQSFDRTLTDEDANQRMESVYEALKSRGFEIR